MNNYKKTIILGSCFFIFWYIFYLNLNILTSQPISTKENHNDTFKYIIIILVFSIIETILIAGFFILICEYLLELFKKLYKKWNDYQKEKKFSTEIEMTGDPVDCCICLDEMEKGIQLKCNHVIHKKCLHNMIEYQINKCPLCCQEFL